MGSRRLLAGGLTLAVTALPLVAGCSGSEARATVTVLAASSLEGSFRALGEQFEEEHSGVSVTVVLGSSATLAEQVVQGAPGDVLATADERTMRSAEAEALDPHEFTSNELVLAVPADNPAGVRRLSDLDHADVNFVVCVPDAPCGALAEQALAGVQRQPRSLEIDVRAVLTKLEAGEADAGLVYRTDVVSSRGQVEGIPLEEPVTTTYWISVLEGAAEPSLAQDFVDFVESEEGQSILAQQGFTPHG